MSRESGEPFPLSANGNAVDAAVTFGLTPTGPVHAGRLAYERWPQQWWASIGQLVACPDPLSRVLAVTGFLELIRGQKELPCSRLW
jgi:hypothetical protein